MWGKWRCNSGEYSPWKVLLAYKLARPFLRRGVGRRPFGRILLCNTGRLGDVFIVTQMLSRLSDYEVGMLVAKEGRAAVEGCPGVKWIHEIEPWYCCLDSKAEKLRKWWAFQKEKRLRRDEFAHYDMVFFSNPHFCGLTGLFPNAFTLGFECHADRDAFSQVVHFNQDLYLGQTYREVCDCLDLPRSPWCSPWCSLVVEPLIKGRYCVMHIGASHRSKEFSAPLWRRVYRGLKARGHRVVFTGKGQRAVIDTITPHSEDNLSDELSWLEFLRVIAHSQLVISVDTVAVHLAAAFQRPLIALYRSAPCNIWCPP